MTISSLQIEFLFVSCLFTLLEFICRYKEEWRPHSYAWHGLQAHGFVNDMPSTRQGEGCAAVLFGLRVVKAFRMANADQ